MKDPSETKETCVNPSCGEWQDDIETILKQINNSLEDVARTGDWSNIDKSKVEYLSQLSEGALDRVDEQGIEWPGVEKKVRWTEIEHKIDDFEENFESAAEYTESLHNLRGTPNPGINKLPETASSLENLTELRDSIETDVAADAEPITNESSEEEEQGPIDGLEAEIEALKEEKEERIEERKTEREEKIEELKAAVEELKEEQQEKIDGLKDEKEDRIGERKEGIDELKAEIEALKDEKQERIGMREAEIDGLDEGSEEQIEELQEQIREIRKQKEDQIDTRRKQIDERREENKEPIEEIREEYEEKIEKTREKYDEQIEETRAENKERITEIREEYDEQITEIREDYEDRIDTRRDQITELRVQDEDRAIEETTERDAAPSERDYDGDKGAASGVTAGGGDNPPSSPVSAPQEGEEAAQSVETRANTATAMANGGEAEAGERATRPTGNNSTDGSTTDSEQVEEIETTDTESVSQGQRWLENPDEEMPDPIPEQYEELNGEPPPEEFRNGHQHETDGPDRMDDRDGRDATGTDQDRDDESAAGGPSF